VRYDVAAGVHPPPRVDATSYVLADLGSGGILAMRDPHRRRPPASTLKMLTGLALLPRLAPSTVYTAVWDDAAVEGSKVGIVPDATYTVDDLFLGLFLSSGNDAALALAHAAGGVPATVTAMNTTAAALGAVDTRARTPHGLDTPGQYSSAYDLALIARAGLARADFRRYVATRSVAFPGAMPARPHGRRPTFMIYNQNRLLGSYPGAFGVKTGYTTLARNTYVGAAHRGGRTLLVSLMDAGPHTADQAAALLDWGFAVDRRVSPVAVLAAAPTAGGSTLRAQARVGPGTAGQALGAGAAAGGGGPLPTMAGVAVALTATVAALRMRVLVRRSRRRRQPGAVGRSAPPGRR
jgi:D-alanyl-D-alanine carboxypeptidase (penicillin-binding protein 5/6)